MGEKKGINPLLIGLGVAAGAAGAILLSKKENRKKAATAIKNAGKTSESLLSRALKTAQDLAGDMDALTKQTALDEATVKKPVKKTAKK